MKKRPIHGRSIYLEGGPAHQDLWDMKPNAPLEVRGDFQPISTSLGGEFVCEHLPMLSRQMHRLALVRSVHHEINDHNAGTYYALPGRSPLVGSKLLVNVEPANFPPSFPAGITRSRLRNRRALLEQVDRSRSALNEYAACAGLESHYQKAFRLLESSHTRDAFDLSREPESIRRRYGLPDRTDRSVSARKFGGLPHLGQCMLLARRLIESGVRLVTVCTGRRIDQTWDTHRDHFPLLKQSILPYVDVAFSALLEDLSERGLLDETLVVAMGEFGRTPELGQITSSAGADAAGRDHWPHCYTVMFAGGGISPGMVYGASDRFAAHPKTNPVTPEDIAATIYTALGLDPETRIYDSFNRPHSLSVGRPIMELFG